MVPIDIEILSKELGALEVLTRIEDGLASYSTHGGNSYSRGRSMNAHSTNRGNSYQESGNFGNNSTRYYDGGSGNSGYSGHSIHDRMIDKFERMMNEAQSDYERQMIQDEINHLRNGK